MQLPSAGIILLVIAAILLALTARGYLRDREFKSQHRTWLIIAAIFIVVALTVGMPG